MTFSKTHNVEHRMVEQPVQVPIPDGLARAAVFMPLPDAIGIPDGRYLFLGDPEFDELAGQPILLGDAPLAGSEGLTPIEVEFLRVESIDPAHCAVKAAYEACTNSPYFPSVHEHEEEMNLNPARTVTRLVAGVTLIVRSRDGRLVGEVIRRALELVQRLQLAYLTSVGGPAIESLTLERLPPLIPAVISPGPPAPPGPGHPAMFFTRPFPSSVDFSWPLLDEQHVHQVVVNTGFARLILARPFFEFRNDAQVQLHRYGNYRQSVIASAAAAESLILTLIELLLWEEGASPSAAAEIVGGREGIVRITSRELPPRLRGAWNVDRSGPTKAWKDNIVTIRNQIVHGGRPVERKEALAALTALEGLVTFVGDRFAIRATQRQYPKTIMLSLGKASLERRGKWNSDLETLLNSSAGQWQIEFQTWRTDMLQHEPV
jgi:hypothetical protein